MLQVISLIEEFTEYAQRTTYIDRCITFLRILKRKILLAKIVHAVCGVVGNAMHEMTSELKMYLFCTDTYHNLSSFVSTLYKLNMID